MDAILVEVRRSSGNRNGRLIKGRYWVKESVTITGRQNSCVRIQMLYAALPHSSSLGAFLSKAFTTLFYQIIVCREGFPFPKWISDHRADSRGQALFVPIWDIEDIPAVT